MENKKAITIIKSRLRTIKDIKKAEFIIINKGNKYKNKLIFY